MKQKLKKEWLLFKIKMENANTHAYWGMLQVTLDGFYEKVEVEPTQNWLEKPLLDWSHGI